MLVALLSLLLLLLVAGGAQGLLQTGWQTSAGGKGGGGSVSGACSDGALVWQTVRGMQQPCSSFFVRCWALHVLVHVPD
jgi:hypothetical protein